MPSQHRTSLLPPAPRNASRKYKLCVVCLGNICRSPMAEVLIRAALDDAGLAGLVSVESAGTGDWHLGERMDSRARAELARRGLDGSAHRARQIGPDWLDRFDLIIAMDERNERNLQRMASGRPDLGQRIRLFRSFDPDAPTGAVVPDPYDAGSQAFSDVYDMMLAAARGLVGGLAKVLAEAPGGRTSDGQPGDGESSDWESGDPQA